MRELLRCRGNRKFVNELVSLGSSAVKEGQFTGEAMLGRLILSLPLNIRHRKYFRADLTEEEYRRFWSMAKVLGVKTKHEVLLALCFIIEKRFQGTIKNTLANAINEHIEAKDKQQ
jgi:hypothetical protein